MTAQHAAQHVNATVAQQTATHGPKPVVTYRVSMLRETQQNPQRNRVFFTPVVACCAEGRRTATEWRRERMNGEPT